MVLTFFFFNVEGLPLFLPITTFKKPYIMEAESTNCGAEHPGEDSGLCL